MRNTLPLILVGTSLCFSLHAQECDIPYRNNGIIGQLVAMSATFQYCPKPPPIPISEIKTLLNKAANALNTAVINKVLTILSCTNQYNIEHNNILTIIDYSLPANEKRLWIFDLAENKLLFHTYVSHGIKSGALLSTLFSNKYDSKSSSIGVYETDKSYYGRHGLSLRLKGLERGFNDNASNRSIVMHGGWYVEEKFIKKYGRAGRSWGCPAVPDNLSKPIINTIKDNSLIVVYYPNDDWLVKSRFLRCEALSSAKNTNLLPVVDIPVVNDNVKRDDILLTELHKYGKSEENTAVAAMPASSYERIFHYKVPLDRMLRRQIDNNEYIALSPAEFATIVANTNQAVTDSGPTALNNIYFVRPVIKMDRGYYGTEMQIVNLGKIKDISLNGTAGYTVHFETKNSINLRSTDRFIRWLGL